MSEFKPGDKVMVPMTVRHTDPNLRLEVEEDGWVGTLSLSPATVHRAKDVEKAMELRAMVNPGMADREEMRELIQEACGYSKPIIDNGHSLGSRMFNLLYRQPEPEEPAAKPPSYSVTNMGRGKFKTESGIPDVSADLADPATRAEMDGPVAEEIADEPDEAPTVDEVPEPHEPAEHLRDLMRSREAPATQRTAPVGQPVEQQPGIAIDDVRKDFEVWFCKNKGGPLDQYDLTWMSDGWYYLRQTQKQYLAFLAGRDSPDISGWTDSPERPGRYSVETENEILTLGATGCDHPAGCTWRYPSGKLFPGKLRKYRCFGPIPADTPPKVEAEASIQTHANDPYEAVCDSPGSDPVFRRKEPLADPAASDEVDASVAEEVKPTAEEVAGHAPIPVGAQADYGKWWLGRMDRGDTPSRFDAFLAGRDSVAVPTADPQTVKAIYLEGMAAGSRMAIDGLSKYLTLVPPDESPKVEAVLTEEAKDVIHDGLELIGGNDCIKESMTRNLQKLAAAGKLTEPDTPAGKARNHSRKHLHKLRTIKESKR